MGKPFPQYVNERGEAAFNETSRVPIVEGGVGKQADIESLADALSPYIEGGPGGGGIDTSGTIAAGDFAKFTDSNTVEGRSASEVRADLGLEVGTDVQAFSADLTDLVTRWTPASAAGPASLDFLEDTDNGANRVRLIGPASVADIDITLPATATGTLYASNNTDVAVADGGTGRSTSTTAYGIIAAGTSATGAHQTIAPGTAGQFLRSGGESALGAFAVPTISEISGLQAALDAKQAADADLTALSAAGNSAILAAVTDAFLAADRTKLNGIEAGADVTDATNVASAGALMAVDAGAKVVILDAVEPVPGGTPAGSLIVRLEA